MNELLPLVYRELHDQAARAFGGERRVVTLQPTALVHEAYLRLSKALRIQWNDRGHFFAVAARVMRQILVDYARARGADKRGGLHTHVPLDDIEAAVAAVANDGRAVEILMLDELMTRLAARSPRQAEVVELRVFAGLTVDECATTLNMSPRTIKTDWQLARAWLVRELG